MVQRLALALSLPLRETNDLLLAAGLAAEYPEASLDDSELAPFVDVIDQMLQIHEPYPAFAIDRRWTIVRANDSAQRFLPEGGERNVVRLMYGGAWRELMANWEDVAWAGALRVQDEAARHPDDDELRTLATFAADRSRHLAAHRTTSSGRVLCPHFRVGDDVVRTISVIAQFGGARDVTLDELRVELFFPADADSARVFARLHREGQ
jgi:hypothetical protein